MKRTILTFCTAFFILFQGGINLNAQSKSELEEMVAKQNAQLDSIKPRLASLEIMYSVTRDSLINGDFDPSKFAVIIDSIRSAADASTSSIADYRAKQKAQSDTLVALKKSYAELTAENTKLNTTVDNCVVMINMTAKNPVTREDLEKGLDANKQAVVEQLKQLKDLLDAGILTQEEFDNKKALILEKW